MSTKPLTEEQCYISFRQYEAYLEKEVRSGSMDKTLARQLLNSARKNYRNQEYNKQLGKIKCA